MKCKDGGRCISKKKICDNVIDCLGGEDEANCHKWTPLFKESDPVQVKSRNNEANQYHVDGNYNETEPIIVNSLDELKKLNEGSTVAPKIGADSISDAWWIKEIHNLLSDDDSAHMEKFTCKM